MKAHSRSFSVSAGMVWLLLGATGAATPQGGDPLGYKGKTLYVHGFELDERLKARIKAIEDSREYLIWKSSNQDGFNVKLMIENERLYLDGLWLEADPVRFKNGRQRVPLSDDGNTERLFASWFTGELERFYGRDLGYTEVRGTVMLYRFKDGCLMSTREEVLAPLEHETGELTSTRPPPMPDAYRGLLRRSLGDAPGNTTNAEQDGADQPATAPESKPEGDDKPKPESEGRSQ